MVFISKLKCDWGFMLLLFKNEGVIWKMCVWCWLVFLVVGKKEWGNEVKFWFICIGEFYVINLFGLLLVFE